jgi:hypothetical protein
VRFAAQFPPAAAPAAVFPNTRTCRTGHPPRRVPPASAVATSRLCPLTPGSGSTTGTQPFGSPLLSIHHQVDGFLARHSRPVSSEGPRTAQVARVARSLPPSMRSTVSGPPRRIGGCRPPSPEGPEIILARIGLRGRGLYHTPRSGLLGAHAPGARCSRRSSGLPWVDDHRVGACPRR